ncbi:MAG: flavodoxin family protein [Gordonibacter sp.]
MNVLLINGSSNEKRCTYTALAEVASALQVEGVETEIAWTGRDPVRGCNGCGGCAKRGDARCIFDDDVVNGLIAKAEAADGIIVGTPVYYAGANGALLAVLDRLFYAASARLRFKPAAGVASARRAGTTPAIDQINKYFQISCMPLVSSNYWPMVHGKSADDVRQDEEGLQIMRVLGRNMAWMLRSLEAARAHGVTTPEVEPKVMTNFIR